MTASTQGHRCGERLGRGVVLMCMLVLALCVTHQLFMATERHATVMGPLHERASFASSPPLGPAAMAMTPEMPGASEAAGERMPRTPQPLIGECPAQQAIIPVLLLLLLVIGTLLGLGWEPSLLAGRPLRSRGLRDFLPPPLAPARRRALLQVFLN